MILSSGRLLSLLMSLMGIGIAGAQPPQSSAPPTKPPGAKSPVQIPNDPAIYFYDARLDALGEAAQKAGADVASGAVFDTEIDNLKTISKLATDRIFSSARRAALARIEGARTWGSLYDLVENARQKSLASGGDIANWNLQITELKALIGPAKAKADSAEAALTSVGSALQDVGNAQEVIQFAKFLSERKLADITPPDLRIVAKVQEAMVSVGTILDELGKQATAPSSRSAVDQMKIDLAKAEVDHLKALIKIEGRRLAGQRDVKSLIAAIQDTLQTCASTDCTFKFTDDNGAETTQDFPRNEQIDKTLENLKTSDRLKTVVYLLENFASFSARTETPARIADLRIAIEERSFTIRKDAIMARSYEQIFLLGTQRIASYYKGGIKPETLAQFAQAAATAGIIPAISFK